MLKMAYEEAKALLSKNREALDKIAAFLIEKETITGKEFMRIFHEVKGIDPEAESEKESRIGMRQTKQQTEEAHEENAGKDTEKDIEKEIQQ